MPRIKRLFAFAALTLGLTTTANAQIVRGTVFDSVTRKPLAGASVWVQGSAQSTISDSAGHFQLDDVPAGERFIAFSSPALDSLGLGTLGAKTSVRGNQPILLASPSFATLARALCRGSTFSADSGIVWGTIRDAATDVRLANARSVLLWSVPNVGADKKVSMSTGSRDIRTDSTGTYYACGVPLQTDISAQATGVKAASAIVQFTVGSHLVTRLDLLVSPEMIAYAAVLDSGKAGHKLPGTASITGVIHDDKQRVVSNASITIASLDTVFRARSDGKFSLTNLPAGSNMLEVRRVGFNAVTTIVDLVPGKTIEAPITLTTLSELEAIKVTAAREATRDRDAFEERRRTGFGYMLQQKDITGKTDVAAVLQTLPSITVNRFRGVVSVSPPQGVTFNHPCQPKVWVDGYRSSFEMMTSLSPDDIRAVEWYPSASRTPSEFTADCSTLVIWTVRSKWGT